MKSDTISLFHIATHILMPFVKEVLRVEQETIDDDTLRHNVYDDRDGRLVLSANIYPHNHAIKEILFPAFRLN